MDIIAEIDVEPSSGRVYEHGWQSWSPTTDYRLDEVPHRPRSQRNHLLCYRPGVTSREDAFQGEGLLAILPAEGEAVRVFAALDGVEEVPSIRAEIRDGRAIITSDGTVDQYSGLADIDLALARWADDFARRRGVTGTRVAPTIWSSWYQYFAHVTEADMVENIGAIDRIDLPVDVIQLDDGYQTAHGDWLTLSDRFDSLPDLVERIAATGRRAGIWVAPFLVFPDSDLARRHPQWLVGGEDNPIDAGHNWNRDLFALDTTHPGAAKWIEEVFTTLRSYGFDFFKVDFLYAGALDGVRHADASPLAAYRSGIEQIRAAIGDAYLLGCGAPILPSVGLFDAMRISPDTEPQYLPKDGDFSQPSIASAMVTGAGRAFQHGRFWVNDPDCLIVRPEIEQRERWAQHVEQFGGLRGSSDSIASLDDWGLETTRRLLAQRPPDRIIPSEETT